MGLPAPIDRTTGAVQAASILPGWVGVDAAAEASAGLGLPVEVENDANLGALAELVWGAGEGQVRGRLHQGLLRNRRRADLRRARSSTASAGPPARSATR